MQILIALGILAATLLLLLLFDWGLPNLAERFGLFLISYARRARQRQAERARRQQEKLSELCEAAVR